MFSVTFINVSGLGVVSAGVGRTGCFIVIDAMLERMKHEKSVDVYGHVTCMRAQRNYMVQTEDQYIFIHEALLEAATCGNTEVPARNLYSHIQKLSQIAAGETATALELEFKVRTFACSHLEYMILLNRPEDATLLLFTRRDRADSPPPRLYLMF